MGGLSVTQNWSAPLVHSIDTVRPGDVLCQSTVQTNRFTLATPANLALVDGVVGGVCFDSASGGNAVRIMLVGALDPDWLGPGDAGLIYIDADGHLSRTANGQSYGYVNRYGDGFFDARPAVSVAVQSVVDVDDFPGDDLGEQIAAADAYLGATNGIIYIPKGDRTITNAITLSDGHSLHFDDGAIATTLVGGPVFTTGSNCAMKAVGSYRGTRIQEPEKDGSDVCIIIADSSARAGGLDEDGDEDISVEGLVFTQGASAVSGVTASLHFGNVKRLRVEGCVFEQTSGFGIQVGNFGSAGYIADDVIIRGNTFDRVGTQNVAIVNARNFSVTDNTMRLGSPAGQTFIDCEPPTDEEKIENFNIDGNRFYLVGGLASNPGAAIALQGSKLGTLKNIRFGSVANNVVYAGDPPTNYLVLGIQLQLCSNVNIADNTIKYTINEGIGVIASEAIHVTGNHLTDTGVDAHQSILLYGANSCYVVDNHLTTMNDAFAIPGIKENGVTYYGQVSDENVITMNHLEFVPRSTYFPGISVDYVPKIITVGAKTKAKCNFINGVMVDADGVDNMTELRSVPIPGTRHANVPPTVSVNGYATAGDSGPGTFVWDSASTETDNGITVIRPTYHDVTGRWIRCPQYLNLTTTARDALSLTSADEGRLTIYNTTDSVIQTWDGSAWQDHW